jgi:hypothetical protein
VSHLFGALNFYCKLFHKGRYGLKASTPPDAVELLEQRRNNLVVLYDAGRWLLHVCGCMSSAGRQDASSRPRGVE